MFRKIIVATVRVVLHLVSVQQPDSRNSRALAAKHIEHCSVASLKWASQVTQLTCRLVTVYRKSLYDRYLGGFSLLLLKDMKSTSGERKFNRNLYRSMSELALKDSKLVFSERRSRSGRA